MRDKFKYLIFIPMLNFIIIVYYWMKLAKNTGSKNIAKTVFKMIGCVFLLTIPRILIYKLTNNSLLNLISTLVFGYALFLLLSFIALKEIQKIEFASRDK